MTITTSSSHQQLISSREIQRRQFLATSAGALAASSLASRLSAAPGKSRPRVAVIFTVFTYRSHAHVLLENFLQPFYFNGQVTDPGVDVVSFYGDQFPDSEMSRKVSKDYNIPIHDSIDKALCCGGKELAVDAVLLIGEHGSYPRTKLGQTMYPRKRFFDESVAVMKRSKKFVPIFNDKHLSYRWDWAKEMYDVARQYKIPFLAGSSVPLAQRKPALELPAGKVIKEAVSIHGGPVESYDFHGLELLQSMVEARRGGEAGVRKIQFFDSKQVKENITKGYWSQELVNQAMKAELGYVPQDLAHIKGEDEIEPHAIQVTYRDGWKGTVLRVGKDSTRWNFACRLKGESSPRATAFYVGPWENRNLFKALSHAIQEHFRAGRAPYPVERTLLVTGMLEAAMQARASESRILKTPHLNFGYQPRDFRAMREMGTSWKLITEETPQPPGFENGTPKSR